jgi:hypothetical protein
MRIIIFIEDREVIKAILKHLGLWLVKSKPTPKAHAPLPGIGTIQGLSKSSCEGRRGRSCRACLDPFKKDGGVIQKKLALQTKDRKGYGAWSIA